MAILPNVNLFLNPILEYFNEIKTEGKPLDCKDKVIKDINLKDEHINSTNENGTSRLDARITWMATYLVKAGLLVRPRRAYVEITEEGTKVLSILGSAPLSVKYLKDNYPEFREFHEGSKTKNSEIQSIETSNDYASDEEETVNSLIQNVDEYYNDIERSLLEKLFREAEGKSTVEQGDILEELSVDLFTKMGYYNAVKTNRGSDGGIDGHFSIDKFNLEKIAFQCKFFQKDKSVPSKDIDAFAGALNKTGFSKGVFITTSRFSKECEYSNITLIDGRKLAKLMREYEINCNVIQTNYQYYLQ